MNLMDEMIRLGLADAPTQYGSGPAKPALPVVTGGPGFVEPEWWPVLCFALEHERGATLFGPRGCGKTTAIGELARRMGKASVILQCAANMQLDSFIGVWAVEGGTTRFVDGPLTAAVRMSGWLVAEEANAVHPGVWSAVNTLTDRSGAGLRLPTGEVVPNSPDFRLVLAYNEGYSGTREVNAALKDRLMPVACGYLGQGQESELVAGMTGCEPMAAARVVDVARLIRAAALRFDLSPRALARWVKLASIMGWKRAYEVAVVDLAGGDSPENAPTRAALTEIGNNAGMENWA